MAVDAKRFERECIYEAHGPLQSLLADMQQIGTIIEASERRRSKLMRWSLLGLAGSVVAFIAGFIALSGLIMIVAPVTFVACIVLFIYSYVHTNKLLGHRGRHDISKQVLANIRHDAHPKAPFAVRVSLASTPQVLSENEWTARKRGKEILYRESWMSIEGPLLDGSKMNEDVTELTRKRSFTNPNGKRKIKTRSRYLLTLRFGYAKDVYGDARPAQLALNEPPRVPVSATVRGVRVDEKAILMKAIVHADNDIPQTSAMLSLGAYRILNLARRAAAAAKGGAV